MATFVEQQFPVHISFGSSGGPMYNVAIVATANGFESRVSRWQYPRHQYTVSYDFLRLDEATGRAHLHEVLAFFHAMGGPAKGFRFKDWADYKSTSAMSATVARTDQTLGTGDGSETQFQLVKKYTVGGETKTRIITKPVSGTVLVEVNGSPVVGPNVTVDYATGVLTFTSPPGNGHVVKAGFEFDVPVRFADNRLETQFSAYMANAAQINLIEVPE